MNNFKVGDKVICINDLYENGQKIIHCKVGSIYKVTGEQFGTVRVKGCNLFFAQWHFSRSLTNKEH